MADHRAHVDFDIRLANGGDLRGTGFRLDLPGPGLDEAAITMLLVRHLGLALVDTVELRGLHVVEEPHHRGSRDDGEPPQTVDAVESEARTRVVDLSHRIRAGLVTYPGLPVPVIEPHLTRERSRDVYAPGTEFAIDVITMAGNTGTYLDSPFHRYADGADLAALDLATLVGLRAEVFHLTDAWTEDRRGIDAVTLADRDVRGAAVLLHTGGDRHFGTPEYAVAAPFLTADGAQYLVDAGAVLVGIDAVNIDDIASGGERPAHTVLLGAGIHVVEHLTNLGALPARGARFTATPPAVEGFGTFPVRAFAEVGDTPLVDAFLGVSHQRP